MKKRTAAITTGWNLLLMALIAMFSIGYAMSTIYPADNTVMFRTNIIENKGLHLTILAGIGFIIFLDFLVSYTLYAYFKSEHRIMATWSAIFRIVYTIIFTLAAYNLYLNSHAVDLAIDGITQHYNLFQSLWFAGLVIFGIHIFIIGLLMLRHQVIPKILCYLTLIAGIAYFGLHILKLSLPEAPFVKMLEMVLALPMTVGELGLAVWLLMRGGKAS